ncbi:AIPR family protein [uncultured Selenomonas sp.]|uniref:AIPR family protein n=1 Tax=uncultured Selenomonas sp. TaxID=159275 RepID=UPI0028EA53A1|nr:AIPR family protein [uncultured Selenomonas sp.]
MRMKELFEGHVDMKDFPNDTTHHFETRALAGFALVMKSGLEVSQACIHITDGYNDMGIDAIYLDESQRKLFVVQSKWRSDGTGSIKQEEALSFAQAIQRVLELDLNGGNDKLMAKTSDIDVALTQMEYQIHAIFIHTGDPCQQEFALNSINKLVEQTNDDISTILVFEEINLKDIYTFLANGQDSMSIDIDDVILLNWGKIDAPFSSYYGTVAASTLGEWYKKYGNLLFAKNIRFYKGNTDVNEGMKRVLLEEPEKFYYYNNGVKVLCKSIKRKAKDSTTNATGLFALEGVSLVNGAQTTGTIASVFMENPEQLGKASVMIQIIDLSNVDTETSTYITRLSNTQNRIESKDFATLDPQQERLRTELTFVHYSYLYKGGDKITNLDKQVSFDEAIVALACANTDLSYTVIAKSNVGALSEDITKPPYKVLVNSSTNSFVVLNAILYMREVELYLQNKKEQTNSNRERLVCIHANRFILHSVLQEGMKDDKFKTTVIEKQYIRNTIGNIVDQLINKITQRIDSLFPESYPANVFKNLTKCKMIEEKL